MTQTPPHQPLWECLVTRHSPLLHTWDTITPHSHHFHHHFQKHEKTPRFMTTIILTPSYFWQNCEIFLPIWMNWHFPRYQISTLVLSVLIKCPLSIFVTFISYDDPLSFPQQEISMFIMMFLHVISHINSHFSAFLQTYQSFSFPNVNKRKLATKTVD